MKKQNYVVRIRWAIQASVGAIPSLTHLPEYRTQIDFLPHIQISEHLCIRPLYMSIPSDLLDHPDEPDSRTHEMQKGTQRMIRRIMVLRSICAIAIAVLETIQAIFQAISSVVGQPLSHLLLLRFLALVYSERTMLLPKHGYYLRHYYLGRPWNPTSLGPTGQHDVS